MFRAAPKGCEDYDYWLRTARHGFKTGFTGKISVGYRTSQNQMSAARDYMVEGECVAIKLNLKGYPSPLVERLKRASSAFQTLGFIYYTNRPHFARRAFFCSWRFWPVNFTPLWLSIKLVWWHGLH